MKSFSADNFFKFSKFLYFLLPVAIIIGNFSINFLIIYSLIFVIYLFFNNRNYKIITNKGAGAATVTPANFAQGANFALAQYDGCQIVWDGTNWYLIGNQGEVTVA